MTQPEVRARPTRGRPAFATGQVGARSRVETVRDAHGGDVGTLDALLPKHRSYVFGIALRLLRDPVDAADAVQDTFVRVLRSIDGFRAVDARFTTWLYRVTANVCLDLLRERRRRPPACSLPDDEDGRADEDSALVDQDRWWQPEARLELRETAADVRLALSRLGPSQRSVLALRYLGGLPECEVARALGLSINTVKSRAHRGRARMARMLAEPERRRSGRAERR
jgi:RNA polymerase sigma-70 factor (ECF subfamily)